MKIIKTEQEIIEFKNTNNQTKQAMKIISLTYIFPNSYNVR